MQEIKYSVVMYARAAIRHVERLSANRTGEEIPGVTNLRINGEPAGAWGFLEIVKGGDIIEYRYQGSERRIVMGLTPGVKDTVELGSRLQYEEVPVYGSN